MEHSIVRMPLKQPDMGEVCPPIWLSRSFKGYVIHRSCFK